MTRVLHLVGPLAAPEMIAALDLKVEAPDRRLTGGLRGGLRAGLPGQQWPVLRAADAVLDHAVVRANAKLERYASVMGLKPVNWQGVRILGAQPDGQDAVPWRPESQSLQLVAAIAREILDADPDMSAEDIASRLPMIAVWADSRLRAANGPVSGGKIVDMRASSDVRIADRSQPFAGFFAVERQTLTHRRHKGGFTPQMTREAFVMGDAVVVLPWDPVRDRVLVIEQFRFAPFIRHDPQPWLLEPIAGRIDAGETAEQAARRETREEADLSLTRLFPAFHHYPSPGAAAEFLYMYVGIADLPDDSAGIHGLAGEVEDIRGHLLDRDELMRMVLANEISNGPLAGLALWLQHQKAALRKELYGA
ncbi:NUDIX domain-containing protein [Paracoccus seriniphilus]|uniref:ADP-ribose pyrophosphatase n=1 Tax=Paracoccus seriniphilus TaxID=184748 RepID=A0A239PR86_9RHOB|nr:NUDIX domain-containing protein [Paracoccus seriniphilus]SNT72785.1 nudix-type nucleoside diphosphatase, YffH/AdpP family [Paracoccus seriniphilus]